MKSETEYETEKRGDIDVYKATTNITMSKEELKSALMSIADITGSNAAQIDMALIMIICDSLAKAIGRTSKIHNEFNEIANQLPIDDISYLRKQIKHCKNPLEEKALQKRLNEALKKAKGKR